MTQEAFNQILEAAHHGNVFAQTALEIMLCDGKVVQQNREHGLGWLRNAAQCKCLLARETFDEYLQQTSPPSPLHDNVMDDTIDYELELNNLIGV